MKKLYKILICFVALISVSVLFFTSTVSAATDTYRRYDWYSVSGNTTHSFFAFDNNLLTLVDNVNRFDFVSLSNQSRPYTEVFLADVGFDAFVFEYEKSTEITNDYCFFSYAFYSDRVNSGLGDLLENLDKVVLNSATTNFVTFNSIVWGYRYSIRSLVDDYTRSTFLYTDWFQPQTLRDERISNDIWQRTYTTPNNYNISFNSYDLRELPENFVVCLDIILRPEHSFAGLNKNLVGVGISEGSSGVLTVYFGDQNEAITRPELDTPYYEQPNNELIGEMESLKDGLVNKNDLAANMDVMWGNFRSSLNVLVNGMASVTSLMDYASNKIPFIDVFIWFSFGLGLVSFIVGIGGAFVGLANKERRSRDNAYYRGLERAHEKRDRSKSDGDGS